MKLTVEMWIMQCGREFHISNKEAGNKTRINDVIDKLIRILNYKVLISSSSRIDPPDYSGREDDSWDANKARSPHDLRDDLSEASASAAERVAKGNDGKHPLLEFAISYFRERDKFEIVLQGPDDEQSDQKSKKKKQKKKSKGGKSEEWTWKDQVELVKWTDRMINNSLLRLEPSDVNKIALECFACVMRYMGDLPLLKNQHEVDCVNTILMYCHKFEAVRNEVYCQMMKQGSNPIEKY